MKTSFLTDFILPLLGIVVALFGIIFYILKFGISHILDYYPGANGIVFRVFKFVATYTLRYENIESCNTFGHLDMSWFDGNFLTVFRTLSIGGWPRLTKVILKLRRGPFSYIGLVPRDANAFAREVQRQIAARQVNGTSSR